MATIAAPSLDSELRRRPIRELRTALTRLGRPIAGCVERGDFVSLLLEATIPELAAALGAEAAQGPVEQATLVRQLLDAAVIPSTDTAANDATSDRLAPGSVVRLFNLQSAPALNMQRASVVRYDPACDRYEVRLDWDGSVKKVRYDNLQMEETSSSPPPSTPGDGIDVTIAQAAGARVTCAAEVIAEPPPLAQLAAPTQEPSCAEAEASQGVVEAPATTVSQEAVGPPSPLDATSASPERKRLCRGDAETIEPMQHTIGASPAESLAESLVDAIAAECGLQDCDTSETGKGQLSEALAAATVSAEDQAAQPELEVPHSSGGEPVVLPMSVDAEAEITREASHEIARDRQCTLDESAEARHSIAEPEPVLLPMSATRTEEEEEMDNERTKCSTDDPCADASIMCGEKPAQPAEASINSAAPHIMPVTTAKGQDSEAPITVSTLSSTLPKKATKLRVCYNVGQHVCEEAGHLAKGLRRLWKAGELCDLTLACRGSTFRVHRVVMASHSKELQDFVGDRAEVEIPGISYPESLNILLHCLYEDEGEKGYAPSSNEVNLEVLELAHRFQLQGLRRRAASFMAQSLTTHNVLRSLGDCDAFGLLDLKEKIIGHLACNKKVLAEITEGPHIFNHPELLRQILVRVASPKDHSGPSKRARLH